MRSCLKVKLHLVVLLGFGLKELKIVLNIMKVGVHSYLLNVHLIYDQILILRNWSRVKLHHAISLRFGLKGVKIAQNVAKVGVQTYLSNEHPNLSSKLNSKKLLESEIPSCGFDRVGLKGGQNSSKRRKSWRAFLSVQYASKSMIKFQF